MVQPKSRLFDFESYLIIRSTQSMIKDEDKTCYTIYENWLVIYEFNQVWCMRYAIS